MEEPRLYRALGLEAGAGLDEIKRAYRRLAKQYHPDVTKDPATGDEFRKVVAAYKVLSVRKRKKNYVDFPVRERNGLRPRAKPASAQPDLHSLGKLVSEGMVAEMRAFAAKRLGFTGKKGAYYYLKNAFFDESEMVVIAAVEAVGRLKIIQSCDQLSRLFGAGSRQVKLAVLDAVERIGRRRGFSAILVMGMKSTDREIRTRSLSIFARLGKEGEYHEFAG